MTGVSGLSSLPVSGDEGVGLGSEAAARSTLLKALGALRRLSVDGCKSGAADAREGLRGGNAPSELLSDPGGDGYPCRSATGWRSFCFDLGAGSTGASACASAGASAGVRVGALVGAGAGFKSNSNWPRGLLGVATVGVPGREAELLLQKWTCRGFTHSALVVVGRLGVPGLAPVPPNDAGSARLVVLPLAKLVLKFDSDALCRSAPIEGGVRSVMDEAMPGLLKTARQLDGGGAAF